MPKSALEKTAWALILLGYLMVGSFFARFTPAWQHPDEPAHYNALRQIAENGCCPIIEAGDWDSAYLARLTSSRFAPQHLGNLSSIQYEDHHPPLYYMLAALVYRGSGGDLLALRLFSVALGAGTLALSYAICRQVLPSQPQVALGVMALVAFLPQHISMMAAVNNDALAELLVALALLWLLRYVRAESPPPWQLSVIIGLAFWTKLTIYFLAPLALLAIWLRWRRCQRPRRELLRSLLLFTLLAGIFGSPWWLRNAQVYGLSDFFGLAAHHQVVHDQPRTADYIAEHGAPATAQALLSTTFKSFWGQFGWMALPLDSVLGGWLYRGFALLSLAGATGALLARRRLKSASGALLMAAIAFVALQFAYYNLEFLQWQGRYFFPALLPLALALVLGIDQWRARLFPRWAAARWLLSLAFFSLSALDVYLLFRVIVPGLSPG